MATTRRKVLIGAVALAGGGLALSWLRPDPKRALLAAPPGSLEPNAWLQLTPDGAITLQVDKAELGQGVVTGYVTLVAEELDVPPERIAFRFAPVHPLFQDPIQLTGGSATLRTRWKPLRVTAAAARQMLLAAGAARFGVGPAGVETDGEGNVRRIGSGETLAYAELATDAARLEVPKDPPLKPRDRYRYIGHQVDRPDIPAKVRGAALYGLDTRLPGLQVAVVRRPDRLLDGVRRYDAAEAEKMPGVRGIVPIHSGVAVLADDTWAARQAAARITLVPEPGALAGEDSASLARRQAEQLTGDTGHRVRNDGEIDQALAGAARVIEAEYALPYLAHAPMEPMNATVWFHDGGCEAWIPNQGPDMARQVICDMSGLPREKVQVHSTYAGGGFGRRATMEFVVEAVEIARHADGPVKLTWTREDDLRHGLYRDATLHRLRGALGTDGRPVAWEHRYTSAGINHLVLPIGLAVVLPGWVPAGPRERASTSLAEFLDRKVASEGGRMGAEKMPYAIPNVRVDLVPWNPGVPVTIWRSVGHSYNGFVIESFIDELAAAAGQDPASFRRAHLAGHPRHLAVLDRVLERAGWGRPAPGRHQGLAVHEAFDTVVAQVAEVSIGADNAIRVHRVVAVVDCGYAVNPDIVRQQVEGGILFGLSAALYGEITLADGAVMQGNFHEYRPVRLAEAPDIEVDIIDSGTEPSGIGEPGVPPIAPAVANAVFAATGRRLRSLPLRL